jgi:ABC-type lipoprotein export system ATPase subunit
MMERVIIEVKNVSKKYIEAEKEKYALNDVSLNVYDKEFLVILGGSGSGKSTLLNLIGGLDNLDSGTILVNGKDISKINKKDLTLYRRNDIGFVYQFYNLLPELTVIQNVTLAPGARDKIVAEKLLDLVGLKDKIDKYPNQLSGGEQQRVAIARSMLNHPKIIIADEPTGNLDPDTAAHIISLLRQVTQSGTAVVMTTHNIPLLDEYPGIVYRCIDHRLEEITNDYNKMALTEEEEVSAQQAVDYSTREDLSM